jgi:hypothetical protein
MDDFVPACFLEGDIKGGITLSLLNPARFNPGVSTNFAGILFT